MTDLPAIKCVHSDWSLKIYRMGLSETVLQIDDEWSTQRACVGLGPDEIRALIEQLQRCLGPLT